MQKYLARRATETLSESIVERVPFGEPGILFLKSKGAGLKVVILNPIHPRIGLVHERL